MSGFDGPDLTGISSTMRIVDQIMRDRAVYDHVRFASQVMEGIRPAFDTARFIRQANSYNVGALLKTWAEPMRELQQQLGSMAELAGRAQEKWLSSLPDNWRTPDGKAGAVHEIYDLMIETGWCLVWCPRLEVLELLLGTADEAERVRLLLANRKLIEEDLRGSLSLVQHEKLSDHRFAALKALTAFEDGHAEAAQALAASCLTSVIGSVYNLRFNQAVAEFDCDPMETAGWAFRASCVDLLVCRSLAQYHSDRGDPVPDTFSRHASAHSVSAVQFTEVNSLASLLLLNAFLRETDVRVVLQTEDVA